MESAVNAIYQNASKFTFSWGFAFAPHPTGPKQANLLVNCAKHNEKQEIYKIMMMKHSGGLPQK